MDTLPTETQKGVKYDRTVIYPLKCSYEKSPLSMKFPEHKSWYVSNYAKGITIIYKYYGLEKDFKKTVVFIRKNIIEMRKKPYNYVKAIESVDITVGYKIKK